MFDDLLLHPSSREALDHFLSNPTPVLLLAGPANIGKHMIAQHLASQLLGVELDKLVTHGMYRELTADKNVINIEQIRDLFQLFALKTPGKNATRRVVVIPNAELMNHSAQNALLKMLEEPPKDAVLILTSSAPHKLLSTITSRTQSLSLRKPTREAILAYMTGRYAVDDIQRAYIMSDGHIGAMLTLLGADVAEDDIGLAEIRRILGLNIFDQLLLIDTTLKDKAVAKQFVDRLAQISSVSLLQAVDNKTAAAQWKRISQASYVAGDALIKNANPKLVLTELMLSLRS